MFKLSKKAIAIILSIVSLMLLCSCNSSKEELSIYNHTWSFKYVQNSDGEIVYCNADNKALYEGAEVLDLWNSAKGGVFVISNNATQETFALECWEKEKTAEAFIYDIKYLIQEDDIAVGLAEVSKTVNENGNSEYTLIVSIEGYSIYFYESIQ